MKSLAVLSVLILATVSPSLAAPPIPTDGDIPPNIHFTLKMLDTDAAGQTVEQTVETLTVADRQARTHAGWKVPIPVTAQTKEGPASFQYQDVGLSLSVQGSIAKQDAKQDRVYALGHVEISGVDPQQTAGASAGPMPQIGTFSHRFEATLVNGKTSRLVAVPKPGGGFVELLLTASVER